MADHPNVELLRKGYTAFGQGDLATVSDLMSDHIVWHSPGDSPLSGDFIGKEQTFGLFGKLLEITGGTFAQEMHDILANDEHGAVMVTATAQRPDGRSLRDRQVHIWHLVDGKTTEFWLFSEDLAAANAFFR